MHEPLITIGVACYNAQDTIGSAIKSALDQNYDNIDIVVVDDYSSDNSTEIVAQLAEKNSCIRLIQHTKNMGVSFVRNNIINNAKGEFIAFFDDDDISLPNRLRTQLNTIVKYEGQASKPKVVCHSARYQEHDDGTKRYEKTIGTATKQTLSGNDVADRMLFGSTKNHGQNIVGSCATCSLMARTDMLKEMGGYDEQLLRSEDTDFCIRFALNDGHFIGIEEPLVTQRMTIGSEKSLKKEYLCEQYLINKHKDYLTRVGWYQFTLGWLDVRHANYKGQTFLFLQLLLKILIRHPIKTMQKVIWAFPAIKTRRAFKKWHARSFDD